MELETTMENIRQTAGKPTYFGEFVAFRAYSHRLT